MQPGVVTSETGLLSVTLMALQVMTQMESWDRDLPSCPVWTPGGGLDWPRSFVLETFGPGEVTSTVPA